MRTAPSLRRLLAVLGIVAVASASSLATTALAGGGQTFTDVPPSHTFHDEIEWLADAGITTGFPDGTFRPGAPVTRQAMAAYLERLTEGISTHRVDVPFPDPSTVWGVVAACPTGKRAIAGGGAVNTADIHLTDSRMDAANTQWELRWEVEPGAGAPSGVTVTGWVTCVPATPAG